MKKVLLVLAVAAMFLGFNSCKKDCICSGSFEFQNMQYEESANVGKMSTSDCEIYTWVNDPEKKNFVYQCVAE